jgi:hypothetical protein
MEFRLEIGRLIEASRSNQQPVVQFRFKKLKDMNDYYCTNGFPQQCSLSELSLLPAYFQEAIYDGISWSDQDAGLQHLEKELELDCIFHNGGKTRKELSPEEFERYIIYSKTAINGASKRQKRTLLSGLLTKLGSIFNDYSK